MGVNPDGFNRAILPSREADPLNPLLVCIRLFPRDVRLSGRAAAWRVTGCGSRVLLGLGISTSSASNWVELVTPSRQLLACRSIPTIVAYFVKKGIEMPSCLPFYPGCTAATGVERGGEATGRPASPALGSLGRPSKFEGSTRFCFFSFCRCGRSYITTPRSIFNHAGHIQIQENLVHCASVVDARVRNYKERFLHSLIIYMIIICHK